MKVSRLNKEVFIMSLSILRREGRQSGWERKLAAEKVR
jgi:hypothetical protein